MSKNKTLKDIDAKLIKSINALANVNRKLCDVIEPEKKPIAYKITDGIPVIIQSEKEIEIVNYQPAKAGWLQVSSNKI